MSMLPLISLRTFIQATRDSGYKTTSSALAELVDNSLEAEATSVSIEIEDGMKAARQFCPGQRRRNEPEDSSVRSPVLRFEQIQFEKRERSVRDGLAQWLLEPSPARGCL